MSTADTARSELAKTYDPAAVEADAYRVWTDEKCFVADPAAPGDSYSIVIPPPNVTGALHLGHAINNTLQDILVRVHRMRGFNTVWIPGIDHAGIATQAVVEKQLKEKENKTRHDVGRDGLVERIWAWKQQYGDRILMQLQRLGCSCDWSRTRFTLDEMCARAVRETFFKLFKDGLVYRGKRLVNWDTHLLTSISDDELYTETTQTSMWHIRYPIDGTDRFMTVATTRPETMLADTAVAVHPDDARWNWAVGKQVRLPLTGRLIPIIADPILVDMAFGSGVVKVTPAHDPNDYAVYARHRGTPTEIAILNLMTPDGRVNDADASWSAYAGLTFAAARKRIVDDLAAGGFHDPATDVKPHEANVNFSDRSKTAIQPYLSDQWFVKMAPLAEPALDAVRDGTIRFFPERHAQQYLSWLGEKRDWPISRQLWWGHRIAVWRLADESKFAARDLKQFAEWARFLRDTDRIAIHNRDLTDPLTTDDELTSLVQSFICVRREDDQPAINFLDHHGFVQDPDVLDTWFSSALWPHSTLGWPAATADLAKWYPTAVLMTGRDIITLWVARMVMMGMYNMSGEDVGSENVKREDVRGEADDGSSLTSSRLHVSAGPVSRSIPFHHVAINPTILDGNGERMSKTKGNGVDPVDVIDSHGADALRFTLTQMATETQDARLPVQLVCPHCAARVPNPTGQAEVFDCPKCRKPFTRALGTNAGTAAAPLAKPTSEKFDAGRNFANKLWNASRFALSNLAGLPASAGSSAVDESNWSLADRWIVTRFNRTLEEANAALEIYRFDQYAKACYDFFWRDFCDWYVEASKPAMKDPARREQSAHVLAAVLDGTLRLLHPMVPFITETIWWKLNEVRPQRGLPGRLECSPSERLIRATWPTVGDYSQAAEFIFPKIQDVIGAIRNLRNEHKADPKKPVMVTIAAPAEPKRQIDANHEMIELLAVCSIVHVAAEVNVPPHAARASAAGCDIYVEGLIDPAAEGQRLAKQREAKQKQAVALRGRLANPSYADKAPAHLVQQTRDELAAVEAELAKLG